VIEAAANDERTRLVEQIINQKSTIDFLTSQLTEKDAALLMLKSELDQLKRLIYGSRSERFIPEVNPEQTTLALDVSLVEEKPGETQKITYERKKKSPTQTVHAGRNPLPSHLPRVEVMLEPKEDISGLKLIGKEITEQLEWDPGKFFVKQFIRPKYAKPQGEGVLMAELPSRPIEKGIPGAGLLANITIEKYADHLPLYRQIERFKRSGISIAPSTMSDWITAACELITPLYEVLKKKILSSSYLQADETPIKVLDRDKKGTTHRGYYWVYRDPVLRLVLFDYRQGRGREGPLEMLKDFKGFLQTDAYEAYNNLKNKHIIQLNCMAHARRYFDQSLDNDQARSEYVLLQFQYLYAIERYCREHQVSFEERKEYRQKDALPILDELHQWLKEQVVQVTPSSAIGKAITYMLSRWDKFTIYTTDGMLEIDNNLIENSIRPVAIGRKNYLFAGSHAAAQHSAMIYSLLASCKQNNLEPYTWLKNIFKIIPDYKASRLEELLPGYKA